MTATSSDGSSYALVDLDRDACLAYLRSAPVGRVVDTQESVPAVRPVNFVLLPDGVYLRTASTGRVLQAADASALVTFEADHVEDDGESGWSVIVLGRASHVTDPLALERVSGLLRRPLAGGGREQVVRISLELVTGRRVGGPAVHGAAQDGDG